MAAEAQIPAAINDQFGRILRVVHGRTMTIFTLKPAMLGGGIVSAFIFMALLADLLAFIFNADVLPIGNAPLSMKAISKILAVYAEIGRHH